MPIIERPAARVSYEVHGEGPTVVLGHSLLCAGHMWASVIPHLAERYRFINVDARGHGASSAERPFTLEDLAQDWLAIMDAEGVERATLCGLSMGGMTAMKVALAAPSRVSALALLDTSAEAEPRRVRLRYRLLAEMLLRVGPREFLVRRVTPLMFGEKAIRERPDLIAREVQQIKRGDPRGFYLATRAVAGRTSVLSKLGSVMCPTLVVVGSDDRATPPFRSERIARAIPNATLEVLAGAGHLTALEEPETIASLLGEFFETSASA